MVISYKSNLKQIARNLRSNMTDSEQSLWARLRRRQVLGVRFYRQKPLGRYIVDFYAPAAKIVVEVDGSQHLDPAHGADDMERDLYLESVGLVVLRFNSRQVLKETDGVMEVIYREVKRRISG